MKTRTQKLFVLPAVLALLTLPAPVSTTLAQPTTFTYQGRLNNPDGPADGNFDFKFALYSAATNGVVLSGPLTNSATVVSNGLFTVPLDFGPDVFTGSNLWLELAVSTNGMNGFATLAPRQQILAAPYAVYSAMAASAGSVAAANINGTIAVTQLSPVVVTNHSSGLNLIGVFGGDGGGLTNLNAGQLANGTVPTRVLAGFQMPDYFTISGGSNNVVDDTFAAIGGGCANTNEGFASTIAGGERNWIQSAADHAVIGGGGFNQIVGAEALPVFDVIAGGYGNEILTNSIWAGIGGGLHNTIFDSSSDSWIGGGEQNKIYGDGSGGFNPVAGNIVGGYDNVIDRNAGGSVIVGGFFNLISNSAAGSVIAGGQNNTIGFASNFSFIGGGVYNTILTQDYQGVIGGGYLNTNGGAYAVIGGGALNASGGAYAVIPGGAQNVANGSFSFAAGQRAKALHQGAFVWADSQAADFSSTGGDQFLIRAAGGVGIGTGAPEAPLHVASAGFPAALMDGTSGYGTWLDLRNQAGGINWLLISTGTNNGEGAGKLLFAAGAGPTASGPQPLVLTAAGATVNGTFNNNSDRNAKQDFASVAPGEILHKVAQLPLSEWSYKSDPETRHIGPMAQDFHSAFAVGTDDRHIAPIDEGGVALAAIQALNQRLEAEAKAKDAKIAELEGRMTKLEALMKR